MSCAVMSFSFFCPNFIIFVSQILRTVSMPGLQMKSEDSNVYIANENDDTSESCLSKQHEDEETKESKASQQNEREADAVVIDDLEDDSNNNVDNDENDDEFVADDGDNDDDDDIDRRLVSLPEFQ